MKPFAIILMLGFCFAFCLAGYKTYLSLTHPIKYKNEIIEVANQYNLEPSMVASVINIESSYNPNSQSTKNAIGLMQIKLSTANYLCEIYNLEPVNESELFIPVTNIKFGCLYLNYLTKKFENTCTALASYNAGETRVRTWLKDKNYSLDGKSLDYIPYEETKNYIKKFKENNKFYKKAYKFD